MSGEKLEYLAMDALADSIEKLSFSFPTLIIDFAGAVTEALKKSGRKKLLVLPATIKKENKLITDVFEKFLPKGSFLVSDNSNNGYKTITIQTKSTECTEYMERTLPERIMDIFVNLSAIKPITNSMFLFGKSLVGKRRESASELYSKMAKSKNLQKAVKEADKAIADKIIAEAETKAKAEAKAKAKAEKDAKNKAEGLKKQAKINENKIETIDKKITNLENEITGYKKDLDKINKEIDLVMKDGNYDQIDSLTEQQQNLQESLDKANDLLKPLLSQKEKVSEEQKQVMMDIERAKKSFGKDMQELFN